jgi:hypothetical protein
VADIVRFILMAIAVAFGSVVARPVTPAATAAPTTPAPLVTASHPATRQPIIRLTSPPTPQTTWPCGQHVTQIPDPNVYALGMVAHIAYVAKAQMVTIRRATAAVSDPPNPRNPELYVVPVQASTALPSGGYADFTTGRWFWVSVPNAGVGNCDGFMWIPASSL